MLRILETEVECWCQHAHRKEDFRGATMIGLFGSNGAGKTNFREAMRFGIMGESANKGTKEADLMFGAKKGSVREVFEVNGVVSEVTRSIATAATHLRIGEGKGAKTFRKAKEVAVELQIDRAALIGGREIVGHARGVPAVVDRLGRALAGGA